MIYVCSPLSGTPEEMKENIKKAEGYCQMIINDGAGNIPIAPHVYLTKFLDDTVQEDRQYGLDMALNLLEKCDSVWVFDDKISSGMSMEIDIAKTLNIKIDYKVYPLKPIMESFFDGRDDSLYDMPMCPNCGEPSYSKNFCPFCGQWINWEV